MSFNSDGIKSEIVEEVLVDLEPLGETVRRSQYLAIGSL
jgi:hypothetical protein